jgi:hypothetical protein
VNSHVVVGSCSKDANLLVPSTQGVHYQLSQYQSEAEKTREPRGVCDYVSERAASAQHRIAEPLLNERKNKWWYITYESQH